MYRHLSAGVLLALTLVSARVESSTFLSQHASARAVRKIIRSGNDLWMATSAGLTRLTPESGDTVHYRRPDLMHDIDLADMVKSSDGSLWIGTTGGFVVHMDISAERFASFNSLNYAGWDIACVKELGGYLLLGGAHGLSIFSKTAGTVQANAEEFGDFELSGVRQIAVYGDTVALLMAEGVAWREGVNPRTVNFNDPQVWQTIDTADVPFISVDRNGIHLMDHKVVYSNGVRFDVYPTVVLRDGQQLVTGVEVRSLVEYGDAVYLGTNGAYLLVANADGSSVTSTLNTLSSSDVRDVAFDQDGVLWVSHGNSGYGMSVLEDGVWRNIAREDEAYPGFGTLGFANDGEMNSVFVSTANDVWYGTYAFGLKWFDRSEERWYSFADTAVPGVQEPSPLARFNPVETNFWTFASALAEDALGNIWVGNERAFNDTVLHVFDPDQRRWASLGRTDYGLPGDYIRQLVTDYSPQSGDHYVYVACVEGESGGGFGMSMLRYRDPFDGQITVQNVSAPASVHDIAVVNDDLLYFATSVGLHRMRDRSPSQVKQMEIVRPPSPIYALTLSPAGHPVFAMDGDLYEYHDSANGMYDSLINLTGSGLLTGDVFSISYEAGDAAYWLSTSKGLFRFATGEYGDEVASDFGDMVVYPNPLSLSKGDAEVVFDRLAENTTILLYDMSGTLIWQSHADDEHGRNGQTVRWSGDNNAGRPLSPGTYYYYAFAGGKKRDVGKLLVIP